MLETVAIVTGASSGIGKATALRLARDFGRVVIAARDTEKLGAVGEQIKALGSEPLVVSLDLMVADSAEKIVKATLDRFGRIDALQYCRRSARSQCVRDDPRTVGQWYGT